MTQGDGFGGPPGGGPRGDKGAGGLGGPAEVGGFGGAAPVPGFGPQGGAPAGGLPPGGGFPAPQPGAPQPAAPQPGVPQAAGPQGGGYGAPPGGGQPAGGGYGAPPGGGYGGPPGGGYGGPPGGGPPGYAAAPPPSASIEQVLENFKLLMSRSGSTGIWGALGAYALVDILFDFIGLVPRYLAAKRLAEGDIFGALAGSSSTQLCTALPLLVGFFVVGAGRLGVVRAQREALLQGVQPRSPGDVLKLSFERFGASLIAMIVFTLLSAVAAFFCVLPAIPAIWVMFMLPFLVAASGMDLGSAFGKSFELAQQHALAIFGTMGLVFLGGLVLFACSLFSGSSPTGVLVGGSVLAVLKAAYFMVVWQLIGATQITIESVATNTPIAPG